MTRLVKSSGPMAVVRFGRPARNGIRTSSVRDTPRTLSGAPCFLIYISFPAEVRTSPRRNSDSTFPAGRM